MNIWIINDDITAAYDLKKKVKSSPVIRPHSKDLKIEVFHDVKSVQAHFEKYGKDASKKPMLVFLDLLGPDQEGPQFYLTLHEMSEDIAANVCFVSASSYGRIQSWFDSQSLLMPPFVEKVRLEKELDKILEMFLTGDEKEKEIKKLNPRQRRSQKGLDGLLKKVSECFYAPGFKEKDMNNVMPELEQIKTIAQELEYKNLEEGAVRIMEFCARKSGGTLRIRRDIKEFLEVGEEITKKVS